MKKFDKELTYKQKLSAIEKIRKYLKNREKTKTYYAFICDAAYFCNIIETYGLYNFSIIFPEMYKKIYNHPHYRIHMTIGGPHDFKTRYKFLNELEKELKEKHNENR